MCLGSVTPQCLAGPHGLKSLPQPSVDSCNVPGMKTPTTPVPDKATPARPDPTPEERAVLAPLAKKLSDGLRVPIIKLSEKDGATKVSVDHPDQRIGNMLLMDALGTADSEFFDGLLRQAINIGTQGADTDSRGANYVLSVVKSIAPKDEIEAMLATQMAAVHMASMTFARRLAHVDNIPQQESASNAFNKLTRTFAVQMEALKRYRTGGEQKVTVQHVTVNDGGQAIVGPITAPTGGGGGG